MKPTKKPRNWEEALTRKAPKGSPEGPPLSARKLGGRKRPPLESSVENSFLKKVKKAGLPVKTRKLNGIGNRDWPDRLIVGLGGFVAWFEFKRPKLGKLSPGQEGLFKELEAWDHPVYVFTDADKAFEALVELLQRNGVSYG